MKFPIFQFLPMPSCVHWSQVSKTSMIFWGSAIKVAFSLFLILPLMLWNIISWSCSYNTTTTKEKIDHSSTTSKYFLTKTSTTSCCISTTWWCLKTWNYFFDPLILNFILVVWQDVSLHTILFYKCCVSIWWTHLPTVSTAKTTWLRTNALIHHYVVFK